MTEQQANDLLAAVAALSQQLSGVSGDIQLFVMGVWIGIGLMLALIFAVCWKVY